MEGYSKKNIWVLTILIIVLIGFGCFFTGILPIVVFDNMYENNPPTEYSNCSSNTDKIEKIWENFEFDKVVLLLDLGDYDDYVCLPGNILPRKVLVSTDTTLINTLKRSSWHFTGGDMCTVSSKILFFKNNHIVRSYYILISEDQVGVQSCGKGWIEAIQKDELLYTFSGFKPYHGLLLHVK